MKSVTFALCFWLRMNAVMVAESVQCRCPAGGEGCCTAIEELPNCNPNTGKQHCAIDYDALPTVWNINQDKYGSCSVYFPLGQFRSSRVTDTRKLAISVVTHSDAEANITVSWAHLNLSFPTGTLIDVRLYKYPKRCVTELSCVDRFFCTMNTSMTSYTFGGAKFNFVNEIQLAARVNSSDTILIMRTRFAPTAEDFLCSNTDVVQFDIQRCIPPVYGNVINLTAEVSSTGSSNVIIAKVSWQPPAKHQLYLAPLFYHVVISQLDGHGIRTAAQVFSVQPRAQNEGSVSLTGLNVTALYSIGVRAFVNCSSCKTAAMSYLTLSGPVSDPTPSRSTVPTSKPLSSSSSTPSSEAFTLSSAHLIQSPFPTSETEPQQQTYVQVIPIAVASTIAFIVLVSCAVIFGMMMIMMMRKKKFRSIFCKAKSSQITPQVSAVSKLPDTDVDQKEPSPVNSPILPPPPDPQNWYLVYSQHPHVVEMASGDGYLPHASLPGESQCPSQEPHFSYLDEDSISASSNTSEYFSKYKVLIIYSPNNHECENKSIRKLSAKLAGSPELNVVSHELEPIREAFSNWLMGHLDREGEGKVHTVLCVWTDTFRTEWNGDSNKVNSDLVMAARKVIDNGSTVSRFKVATVYLDDSGPILLPISLNATSKFHISNIHAIKTFIKGVAPFSTH